MAFIKKKVKRKTTIGWSERVVETIDMLESYNACMKGIGLLLVIPFNSTYLGKLKKNNEEEERPGI